MKYLPISLLFFCLTFVAKGEDEKSVLGYLEPYRSIEMNVSESGMIGEIHVKEGDAVREGDALVSLNNSVLEAQLEIAKIQAQSEAAVIVANADLKVAQDRFEALSRLRSSGTAHTSEVARAEAEVKKAEGQVSIADEERQIASFRVDEIKAQIERRILRSPIDGVVLDIARDVSESAAMSSQGGEPKPLVRVAQLDRLKLVVHVPAALAVGITEGATMPIRVLQKNSLSNERGNSAIDTVGTIEFVSPAIHPSSETLRTRLVVENPDGKLVSGSHALMLFQ
ncbi:MAG: efflux RND transporter periplasmic adaptor subunit [Verrucomicrobiales bacterium]|jgi:RND family efflux transporter MFP subunit|nr:efflux RND transporter periplasmic adaptor subunit [Verrucomicrobiales bacterium]